LEAPAIHLKPRELALAKRLVDAGYKTLATSLHPDRGGDAEQMRELNALASSMRQQLAAIEGGA
jgi:hypothetical protein